MNEDRVRDQRPVEMIAAAIMRERQRAGKSLSALASDAGIAKSTLSQLEAAIGNPSVETLWAIAGALNVPFSTLFETPMIGTTLIRAGNGDAIGSEQSAFAAILLAKCPPSRHRDLYRLDMQPGSVRRAKAHPAGTSEHAMVCQGRLRLGPVDATEEIGPGDYVSYPADVPHLYEALVPDTIALLVMESR